MLRSIILDVFSGVFRIILNTRILYYEHMITEELLNFIETQLKQGADKNEIKKTLLENGWSEADVNEAFSIVELGAVKKEEKELPPSPISNISNSTSVSCNYNTTNTTGSLPSATSLLKEAWDIYKKKIWTFLGIELILPILSGILIFVLMFVLVISFGASYFFSLFQTSGIPQETPNLNTGVIIAFVIALVLVIAVGVIAQLIAQVGLLYAIKDRQEGIGIKEAYKRGWRKIRPYLWIQIIGGFATMAGFIFLIIPGIIMAVWFSLAIFVLASEDLQGTHAILKSKEYVKGYWGAVFWRIIYLVVIMIVISIGLSTIFSIARIPAMGSIANMILNIFLTPLFFIYYYLVYEKLKLLKGDLSFSPTSGQKTALTIVAIVGALIIPLILGSIIAARKKALDISDPQNFMMPNIQTPYNFDK